MTYHFDASDAEALTPEAREEALAAEALTFEFEHMAEDAAGQPSAVDSGRALAAGRRSVRRRRTLGGLCGAAALGLAALVAVPALAPAVSPPATVSGSPAYVPATATAPVDPLGAQASFGWLPTALTARGHATDAPAGFDSVVAYDPTPIGASGLNTSAVLYTWPRNGSGPFVQHTSIPGISVAKTQIGTLNGYPVERYATTESGGLDNAVTGGWLVPPKCETSTQMGTSLAQEGITSYGLVAVEWRTPSGGWADIEYNYVDQPAPDAAALLHMARTVTFGTSALTMPFRVTGLAGLQVYTAEQGQYQTVAQHYNSLQFLQDGVLIDISVNAPASEVLECGQQPGPDLFATRKIDGLDFTVYISAATKGANLASFGTAPEILDHITSYGPDPANWTTQVIEP